VVLDDQREEVAQHLLRDVEVGDDAVLHRPHGDDAFGRAPEHALRLEADTLDLLRLPIDRHDGRLVEHDAFVLHVDQGVRGAEIDTDGVRGKEGSRLPERPAHQAIRNVIFRGGRHGRKEVGIEQVNLAAQPTHYKALA
jgi:hypothetical protein